MSDPTRPPTDDDSDDPNRMATSQLFQEIRREIEHLAIENTELRRANEILKSQVDHLARHTNWMHRVEGLRCVVHAPHAMTRDEIVWNRAIDAVQDLIREGD